MSWVFELPRELFDELFSYLDTRDLKALACVNRAFYNFATREIWSHAHGDKQKQRQIFMWACASGSTRALSKLLEAGLTANCNYQAGHRKHIRGLRRFSPYLDTYHWRSTPHTGLASSFWTPLHAAVMHGQGQIVDILLEHGAWIDSPSMNYCDLEKWNLSPEGKYTPLHVALYAGEEEIANTLISKGASIHVDREVRRPQRTYGSGRGRLTALHCCAIYNRLSTAEFLIEQGHIEAIDELDEFGFSPLMYAYHYRNRCAFQFLLDQGASTRIPTTTSRPGVGSEAFKSAFSSMMHQACFDGERFYVVDLINNGIDLSEPDRNGEQPLLHLIRWLDFFCPEEYETITTVSVYVDSFKSWGLHTQTNTKTLTGGIKIALRRALVPLVSYLLDDAELDISTILHLEPNFMEKSTGPSVWEPSRLFWGWLPSPALPLESKSFRFFDAQPCYRDTGIYEVQQTLLEYACFHATANSDMPKVVELLLERGCLKPGDVSGYVRALKNIVSRKDWSRQVLDECVLMICSHLSSTLPSEFEKPTIPIDLLFICIHERCPFMLDELAKIFNFTKTKFSNSEIWRLFQAVTDHATWNQGLWEGIGYSGQLKCLGYVLRVDNDGCLLRHDYTFEGLCRAFLTGEGDQGAAAVMEHLDRGGRYAFTFSTGATAIYHACHAGSVQLVKRLIDLGADPDKHLTHGIEDATYNYDAMWLNHLVKDKQETIWNLLLNEGANPFRWHEKNPHVGFRWQECFDVDEEVSFGFSHDIFGEMCKFATDSSSDNGDLSQVLEILCSHGRFTKIQEMSERAKSRVDAVISDKAALFLQKLLDNLSPQSKIAYTRSDFYTIKQMDEAIDTIGLILELGPSSTPTSSWRVGVSQKGFTALEFIKNCLAPPPDPHEVFSPDDEKCDYKDQRHWRIHWCLKQRLEMGYDSADRPKVTILSRRIEWPSEWSIPDESLESSSRDEVTGGFYWMRLPWGCNCEHFWPRNSPWKQRSYMNNDGGQF
ncbi:ankyrin repeat-containing domain protein [Apiospora saccharicola]